MGRYDLRPLHVNKLATRQLAAKQITHPPPWTNIIASVPPTAILTRTQPVRLNPPPRRSRKQRNSKPSRMFQPQPISYAEDALRAQFFSDHPWELARPRVVLEDDGRDSEHVDWSRGIKQPRRATDGESVVQRTQYLLQAPRPLAADGTRPPPLTLAQAYDMARRELYAVRHSEEVARRVALEEAQSTGAWFGPSAVDVGMQLEDKAWDKMVAWANKRAEDKLMLRMNAYTGAQSHDDELADPVDEDADSQHDEEPRGNT